MVVIKKQRAAGIETMHFIMILFKQLAYKNAN